MSILSQRQSINVGKDQTQVNSAVTVKVIHNVSIDSFSSIYFEIDEKNRKHQGIE